MLKKRMASVVLAVVMILAVIPGSVVRAETNVVNVSDADELRNAIASNTEIILGANTYTFPYELYISNVENLSIIGTDGAKILSTSSQDTVISVYNSKNINISNVFIGHDVPSEGGCSSGVIYMYLSENVVFDNCDIYGCGTEGFSISESTAKFDNCTIRDCSINIGNAYNSGIVFNNCVFKNNGYGNDSTGSAYGNGTSAISVYNYDTNITVPMTFNDCSFENNNNRFFKMESGEDISGNSSDEESYNTGYTRVYNSTFTGNTWQTGGQSTTTNNDAQPDYSTAALSTSSTVIVNGEHVEFGAYNIGGYNYFKLRDLAYVINGTEKQFEVSYDEAADAIVLTSDMPYTVVGGELQASDNENKAAFETTSMVLLNGDAIVFTAYNIDGNNYFKLRDIGAAFDFGVYYVEADDAIFIDTSISYTP